MLLLFTVAICCFRNSFVAQCLYWIVLGASFHSAARIMTRLYKAFKWLGDIVSWIHHPSGNAANEAKASRACEIRLNHVPGSYESDGTLNVPDRATSTEMNWMAFGDLSSVFHDNAMDVSQKTYGSPLAVPIAPSMQSGELRFWMLPPMLRAWLSQSCRRDS